MENNTPLISTPIDCGKTIDSEKNFLNKTNTYELKFDLDIYLITVEINTKEKITFRVFKKNYIILLFFSNGL